MDKGMFLKNPFSVKLYSILLFILLFTNIATAEAKSMTEIRDEELETCIREIAKPIFEAAGLPNKNIHIHLIKDKQINAFVANGTNIFVYTGLLLKIDDIGQLGGVFAHETGHIKAGHLSRITQQYEDAQKTTLASYILGMAGSLITGRPDVGFAVVLGTSSAAENSLYNYRQSEENSADQIAVDLLDKLQVSSKGLLDFMKIIQQNNIMSGTTTPTYRRTHPLTTDRIQFLENHVENSPFSNNPFDRNLNKRYLMAKAKLFAFIENPERTFSQYPNSDTSDEALYARAIAFHKKYDTENTQKEIDTLLKRHPNNPYLLELKGQTLFERGKLREAIAPYKEAIENAPNSSLILSGLSHLAIELSADRKTPPEESKKLLNDAITYLKKATKIERNNAFAWKLFSISYGRLKDFGLSTYALAEYNLLTGRYQNAIDNATRAKEILKYGSVEWIRSEDIITYAKNKKKQNKSKK
jgi:predicted Zn-dependent protease